LLACLPPAPGLSIVSDRRPENHFQRLILPFPHPDATGTDPPDVWSSREKTTSDQMTVAPGRGERI
jgi:hypothetical protein